MRRSSPGYRSIIAHRLPFWRCVLALILSLAGRTLDAQEQIRPSEVSEASAELRRRAPIGTDYNLEIGPLLLKASAGMSVQFNDNINLSETHREADLIVSPDIGLNITWPVTATNVLSFATVVGFQEYVAHPNRAGSVITIAPNSALSFDIYTGDFRINLHDQFSVTDDPVNNSDLSNVTSYVAYSNTIGVGVLWDIHAAILTLDVDQTNVITPQTSGNTSAIPDDTHSTESASLSALVPLTAISNAGLTTSYAYTSYAQQSRGTATTLSFGPFFQTRLSPYTQLNVSGGYQGIYFRGEGGVVGNAVPPGGSLSSYYASLSFTHQLNRYYSDNLSIGRQSQLGIVSAQQEYYFLSYGSQWNASKHLSLGSALALQDVQESSGIGSDHYDQVQLNIGTSYQATRKLVVSLGYQLTLKLADVANQGYIQDALTLQFAYSF